MLNLRRRKKDIVDDCRALQIKLREFSERLRTLEPAVEAESEYLSNAFLLQSFGNRERDRSINETLREARRIHTKLRKEFLILIEISLAAQSAAEYRRHNRSAGYVLAGNVSANYDILLHEIDRTIDQIDYFVMEVEASEEIIHDSDAEDIDLAIVIPLRDEFAVFSKLADIQKNERKNGRYYYRCSFDGPDGASVSAVVTMIGDMGITRAAVVTSELLRHFRPKMIGMIGLAGSVSSDLLLGDVVVAKGIDDYGSSAKAEDSADEDGSFEILSGGPVFTPTREIVELAKNIEFAFHEEYSAWQSSASQRLEYAGTDRKGRKVRTMPALAVETVASGNFVYASKGFNRFLRERRNREIKCIEMESSGLMNTAHQFAGMRTVVVRGISDHADDEKAVLEREHANFFREYAMTNAVEMFRILVSLHDFWTI